MEFLSKYELRERITSGPIEVFLSQELRTGLSRLVHVLEWKEDSEVVTSTEILALIRRWAPEPPGVILEAGRDPQIPYAYLVTTLPADPLAVQAWVQAYERLAKGVRGNSFAKALQALKSETAALSEPSALQEKGLHESEAATAALDISSLNPSASGATKSGAEKSAAEPGEFTRAFGEVAAPQPKVSSSQLPVADAGAPKRPASAGREALPEVGQSSESWTRRETGAFTKEFLGVLGDGPAEPDAPALRPLRPARRNPFRLGLPQGLLRQSAPISCPISTFQPPSRNIRRSKETLIGGTRPSQTPDPRWDRRWGLGRIRANSQISSMEPARSGQVNRPTDCRSQRKIGSRNLTADFAMNPAGPERIYSTTNFSLTPRSRRPRRLRKI